VLPLGAMYWSFKVCVNRKGVMKHSFLTKNSLTCDDGCQYDASGGVGVSGVNPPPLPKGVPLGPAPPIFLWGGCCYLWGRWIG
jgi:hypothetical protein